MGLERVVDNIVAKGKNESEDILAAARREADVLVKAAESEAAAVKAKRAKELAEAVESLKRREHASAELEAKKRRLYAEREVLAAVRQAVEKQLANLPEADRKKHLQTLAERANVKGGRVLVRASDKKLAESLGLDVAGTFEGLGGLVVQSPDGLTTENLRYENLLDDVWRENLGEAARLLLGSTAQAAAPARK